MTSIEILFFIKWIVMIQLLLILFLLVLTFSTKCYLNYKTRQETLLAKKIEEKWLYLIKENKTISPKSLNFKRQPPLYLLLETIKKLDHAFSITEWKEKRDQLIEIAILPRARKLSSSRNWFDRYMACQGFELDDHMGSGDEDIIKKRLFDKVPIVAIAAIRAALSLNSQAIIDVMIDRFSEVRRMQQSFYADLLSTAPKNRTLFLSKLMRTKDPYARAFCYRVLSLFPPPFELVSSIEEDLQSENKELKLSALTYLSYSQPKKSEEILITALTDAVWEVRARAAYLLGTLKMLSAVQALEKTLKDPEWWVRINSAEALVKMGRIGIKILEAQTPEIDRYAYEVAQFFLIKLQVEKGQA